MERSCVNFFDAQMPLVFFYTTALYRASLRIPRPSLLQITHHPPPPLLHAVPSIVLSTSDPQWASREDDGSQPLCLVVFIHTPSIHPFLPSPHTFAVFHLTNDQLSVLGELVFGNLEVERGRALAYTPGNVVVGSVAGAEPATEVASLADGHTTKMRADTCSFPVSILLLV